MKNFKKFAILFFALVMMSEVRALSEMTGAPKMEGGFSMSGDCQKIHEKAVLERNQLGEKSWINRFFTGKQDNYRQAKIDSRESAAALYANELVNKKKSTLIEDEKTEAFMYMRKKILKKNSNISDPEFATLLLKGVCSPSSEKDAKNYDQPRGEKVPTYVEITPVNNVKEEAKHILESNDQVAKKS